MQVTFWRQVLKWVFVTALAVGLIVGGTVAGWRLAGEVDENTAIGGVALQIEPSLGGEIEAFVPVAEWGIRADAFGAPFKLRAELRSVDRQAVLRAAEGDTAVLDQTRTDLRSAAEAVVIHAVLWGLIVSLLLLVVATLLWRGLTPRWSLMGIGLLVLVLLYGGSALRARSTFDVAAFESPTYFAKGDEIGRILDLATEARVKSDYGDDFISIVRSLSTTLAAGQEPHLGGIEVFAGSDLHANPLVIDPVADLIGDKPLLLSGDFGQRGSEAESRLLVPKVAALGTQVVAVSGNHDSHRLMERLADQGVVVLGQRGRLEDGQFHPPPVVEVDGLAIAGYRDPLEYEGVDPNSADRPVTADKLADPEAAIERWRQELLKWFLALPRPPAVLMIHQDGLAQWLAGALREARYIQPLTIVTGHDHRQHVDRYGQIIVVDGGSIGAGGLFGAGRESVGLAQLRFTRQSVLESVDLIAVEPISGSARATRIVIDSMCPVERRCRVEPDNELPDVPELP